jgi:alkylation response protein AidB-like acyl-CoA dehydrogenase
MPVDGGWRLSGQKSWCTRGAFCDHLFGLFRTDPEAQRHHGLSYFMVPLDAEGITVRPFGRLDGDDGFAEVFFDDVFVPDRDVIGDVGRGWQIAMATTGSERGLTLRSPGRFLAAADRLVELYNRSSHDPLLRDRVVRSWIDAQAYQLYTLQTVTRMVEGQSLGATSSLNKIFWSEMDVRLQETALALLGSEAELDGAWMKGFQFALAGPIYAGTNEIQRNIAAQRVLGLPRK